MCDKKPYYKRQAASIVIKMAKMRGRGQDTNGGDMTRMYWCADCAAKNPSKPYHLTSKPLRSRPQRILAS